MPKQTNATADHDADQAEVVQQEPEVTLTEFCTRLSMTDKRVELIGGFEFTERVARRVKDAESAYRSRFNAFINKPV